MKPQPCRKIGLVLLALLLTLALLTGPVAAGPVSPGPDERRPIIVQGAMTIEVAKLAGLLENANEQTFGPYTFWQGTIDDYPVIVSKTLIGTANAAAATLLAIEKFRPLAIVNQGTAGGHDPALKVYDIIIGQKIINGGAIQSGRKALGQGSNPFEWRLVDWQRFGDSDADPRPHRPSVFTSDAALAATAGSVAAGYAKGKVVAGTIVSADFWNRELDRIKWFHDTFGTAAEEMETAAAAQISSQYNVPFLSLRIISNNAMSGSEFVAATGDAGQDFTYQVVKAYIAAL